MPEIKQPTTHVRLTAKHWDEIKAALQYADVNVGGVSPDTLKLFAGRKFTPRHPVISQAADLIDLFVAVRFVPGPLTVFVEGPQGSGKTTLTAAIHHALATVEVPTQLAGADPIEGEPVVLLADVPYTAARPKALTSGEIVQAIYKPIRQRVRERFTRTFDRIREALSR